MLVLVRIQVWQLKQGGRPLLGRQIIIQIRGLKLVAAQLWLTCRSHHAYIELSSVLKQILSWNNLVIFLLRQLIRLSIIDIIELCWRLLFLFSPEMCCILSKINVFIKLLICVGNERLTLNTRHQRVHPFFVYKGI